MANGDVLTIVDDHQEFAAPPALAAVLAAGSDGDNGNITGVSSIQSNGSLDLVANGQSAGVGVYGGSGAAGENGGDVNLIGGQGNGTGGGAQITVRGGNASGAVQGIILTGVPTSDPHVVGQIYSSSGTLKISAG